MSKSVNNNKRRKVSSEEEDCEIMKNNTEENEFVLFEVEKNLLKMNNWQLFEKKEIGKKIQIIPRCLHKLPCIQKGIQFMCVHSKNVGKSDAVKMCKFTSQIKHINQWMQPGFIKNPEGKVNWDFCKTCKTVTLGELSFPNQANSYFPSMYCACRGAGMRVTNVIVNQQDDNDDSLYDYATFKAYQQNKNEESNTTKIKKVDDIDVFVPEEEN